MSLCPSSGQLTNAGPEGEPVDSDLVREYKDIFIKVKMWGAFEEFDIQENEIYMCNEVRAPVLDFVTNLEQKLDRRRGLAVADDVCCFFDHSFDAHRSYVGAYRLQSDPRCWIFERIF